MADDVDLGIPDVGSVALVRRGDLSELYSGLQEGFRRKVAIKLYTAGGTQKAARERFDRECAVMGELSHHPHIVTFFASGQARRRSPYVVTEWLTDGSLETLLTREGPLPWRRVLDIGVKLAGALESAHRAGILHGKLKPDDVFVSSFGEPLLGDFQLDPTDEGRSGDPYESLLHAAPELVRGEEASPASDVYALASTLYNLVDGRAPFLEEANEPLVRIKGRALTGEPRDLRRLGVPPVVHGVLRWALRPDPAERPGGARELGRALQAVQMATGEQKTPLLISPLTDEDRALPEPSVPAAALAGIDPVAIGATAALDATGLSLRARMSPDALLEQVRGLLSVAADAWAGTPAAARVAEIEAHIEEPLRVAIAGKVKAGKSTLLNGLVGDELAPTDASECTRIVTWYRAGLTYRAALHLKDGTEVASTPKREAGAIDVDLRGHHADDIERIVVDWPTSALADLTLIDTPGLASISKDVSARTHRFLSANGDRESEADAVLYLMRHFHPTDARFLESFHDEELARPSPANAIGVLSRADEVGGGRPSAMEDARQVAARYRGDDQIRRLCQTVLPVAGLLAQAGARLRQVEYDALHKLAQIDGQEFAVLVASADRFTAGDTVGGVPVERRRRLLGVLGLYGVTLAIGLIRDGEVEDADSLARRLVDHSGLNELRHVLITQFAARRGVLKAAWGLQALERLLRTSPPADAGDLEFELERVKAGAHLIAEMRLFAAHRAGSLSLGGDPDDVDRLLGAHGFAPVDRLGLDEDADTAEVRQAAMDAISTWRRRAALPTLSREAQLGAHVLVQTCEGIVFGLDAAGVGS